MFRRGFEWKAKVDKADPNELIEFTKFMTHCNSFGQSLEEVLRQVHWDLNCIDDAFIFLSKTYHVSDDGKLTSKVDEIRRINPALIEFDLDENGLPQRQTYLCVIHRNITSEKPGECEECGNEFRPAMYKYTHRNQIL